MSETILVSGLVLVAVAYLLRRFYLSSVRASQPGASCSGCSSCPEPDTETSAK